ncbi:MAG: hypothetical protein KAU48_06290 [Candidatus Thorarchaeota archaeon]|nr:hypothetical protein [Candidatus Thorarchaeota archaeon]
MAQDKNCGTALGLILIIVPIFALLFGTDEPAMQTDQAALVMTAMIIIGVITIANSRNKQAISQPTQVHTQIPTQSTTDTQVIKVLVICPYCGAKTEQGIGKCQNCQADL